jgi:formate hydrogenlyase subunit 3/multisubunit Na+/H+ antiporter MnhD subunit
VRGTDLLIAAALAFPLGLLLACVSHRVRARMPSLLVLAPLPALAAALLSVDAPALVIGQGTLRLTFILDYPGAILLGVAAFLWSVAGLYAVTYMRGTPNHGRFTVCWLMTLTGCLGIFIAADMAGFYLLLALLSVGATGLVIHEQTPRAWRSGAMYLGLALAGESCVLMGFVLLAANSPGDGLLIRESVAALPSSPWRDLTLALLIVGLGLKAGLVPLHVWMPLAHAAAPMPASAVLSGAVVKVGILGLGRFLPLATALPEWGIALTAAGLFTALYGVAIGVTQRHPKAVLAYSSVSQMGLIVAVLGMGLTSGDVSAALSAAYYAAHHVLVKGALFLAIGIVAATGARRLWPLLVAVAVLALSLGGLPLTGGALAKYAVKGPLGEGLAGTLANVSAAGTTLLMLHFVHRLRRNAAEDAGATPPAGLLWPWVAIALACVIGPWGLYLWVPRGLVDNVFAPAALWSALGPVLAGAAIALALQRWGGGLPRIPEGDIAVVIDGAVRRAIALAPSFVRADAVLRRWPVAGLAMLGIALALGVAMVLG